MSEARKKGVAIFTDRVLKRLSLPLDPSRVSKRSGGGNRQLSYLEGHDAIRTANEIFGVGSWGYTTKEIRNLGTQEFSGSNNRTGVRTGYIAVVEVWIKGKFIANEYQIVTFSDVGYGDGMDYGGNEISPHELAAKEAVTDGIKRCLKNLGDQFGLSLYDKDAPEHEGKWRDMVGELKTRVQALALSQGAKSAEDVTSMFDVELDDLNDPDKLREILEKN